MDTLSVKLSDDLYADDDIYQSQVKPYCETLLRKLLAHMPEKLEHSNRVGLLTFKTALQMGYTQEESRKMGEAARLHDIGYMVFPVSTWVSEEKPDAVEKLKRKLLHTNAGHEILTECPASHEFITIAAEGAKYHHEALNGKGPYGETELSAYIEIIGACDAYDGDAILKPGVTEKTGQEILDRMTIAEKYADGYKQNVINALAVIEGLIPPTTGMVAA